MENRDGAIDLVTLLEDTLSSEGNIGGRHEVEVVNWNAADEREHADSFTSLAAATGVSLRAALIDTYRFSQECLRRAFEGVQPNVLVQPFAGVADCLRATNLDADVIVYVAHEELEDDAVTNAIAALRHAFARIPLIVLSDAHEAQDPQVIRRMLKSGAQGFIPTRMMGISTALAAIHMVRAGETFAPVDLLLVDRPKPSASPPPPGSSERLTPRQRAVFSLLQQGKANKLIAYELRMSESTAKCHVRAIMRKLGATNRTQAAYKAQTVLSGRPLQAAEL
jgi:DNA-binding NarL/FixJ family response regulator